MSLKRASAQSSEHILRIRGVKSTDRGIALDYGSS